MSQQAASTASEAFFQSEEEYQKIALLRVSRVHAGILS